jgi:hypothetical protein
VLLSKPGVARLLQDDEQATSRAFRCDLKLSKLAYCKPVHEGVEPITQSQQTPSSIVTIPLSIFVIEVMGGIEPAQTLTLKRLKMANQLSLQTKPCLQLMAQLFNAADASEG